MPLIYQNPMPIKNIGDPLNGNDKIGNNFNFRLIPILRSSDLVNWTYMGDTFSVRPGWVADDAGLWAPEIRFSNGQYYLYYTASWTDLPGGGSAIGVATSPSPLGPWTDSGTPAVEPHGADCCGPDSRRWVFDPDVVKDDDGQLYIFYGSYFGGISARKLSADGLVSDPGSQVDIAIANRYEGTEIVKHDGYWYLFASATNCCNGPLTGYSVFVGRSQNLLGPYVDRDGASLSAGRVGGTPALSMNGNRWVGLGHNPSFRTLAGSGGPSITRRIVTIPTLLARLVSPNDLCCWMRSIGWMAGPLYVAVSGRRISHNIACCTASHADRLSANVPAC